MHLDVRVPMGWLFLCLGLILVVYSLTTGTAAGENLNLKWGALLAVFGGIVLVIARKRKS